MKLDHLVQFALLLVILNPMYVSKICSDKKELENRINLLKRLNGKSRGSCPRLSA